MTHQLVEFGEGLRLDEVLRLEAPRLVLEVHGVEPLVLGVVQAEVDVRRLGPDGLGEVT